MLKFGALRSRGFALTAIALILVSNQAAAAVPAWATTALTDAQADATTIGTAVGAVIAVIIGITLSIKLIKRMIAKV